MTAIITEKFRSHNAEQFFESFSEAAKNAYYMMIGKATPFTSATSGGTDALPPTPADDVSSEYYLWDQTIAAKNIAASDATFAIPRRDWQNGVVYDKYQDNISSSNLSQSGTGTLWDSLYFFRTSDNRIYKVMNNNGNVGYNGSEPTSESTSLFAQGGYILKYMYTISASEQTKFLTTDFMPVSTDSAVSSAAIDGSIVSLSVTGGASYTDGTYYVAVNGDGTSAGTSSGAVISFTVSSGSIQDFGLTSGTDTIVYAAGVLYTYGTVTLTDDTVFANAALTTAVDSGDIDNGSGGAISVLISPKGGHGFDAVQELGGHYVMLNTLFIGAERDDLLTGNDFRNIAIVTDPTNYGTTTVASDQTARQTYALKLASLSGTFTVDEKITQASTGAVGRVVQWDATNSILYYQQERYTDYGTNSLGAYVAFSGANAVTGATSAAAGTPDSTADAAVTLANGFTVTFADGYANPELQPDSGNIIYTENRSPISRATDQTEDIKIVVEF